MSPTPANNDANIVVVGQAGQGTILVSKILVTALHRAGRPVLATEFPAITHRFAITYAHIRTGSGLASPRIRPRQATAVLGLEPFETLRAGLLFSHPGTVVVTSDTFVRTEGEPNHLLRDPIPVGSADEVVQAFHGRGIAQVSVIPATRLALDVVKHRAGANMVLLGAVFASGRLPLTQDELEDVIVELAPRDTGVRNRDGFRAGIEAFGRGAR
jgi:indolepyruvate ferredoxin oxidoreductase beta subunit